MSLKFPFKFKHKDGTKAYTAKLTEYINVNVHWTEKDGTIEHTYYSLRYVAANIRSGIWIIIEEPSPVVSITQDEYDSMVEEINLLQELLAEANNRIVDLENKSEFKPIKDMTIRDWDLATLENHKFKTRDGNEIHIVTVDNGGSIWSVGTTYGWHRVDGTFHPEDDVAEDIIERIS